MTGAAAAPLLVRFGRVGDMVLQAPLLALLHRRYGAPCRILATGDWTSALYARHPDVAEVRELRGRHRPYWLSPERHRAVRWMRRHDGPVYVSETMPRQVAKIRRLLRRARVEADRCVFLADAAPGATHWVDRLLEFGRRTPEAFAARAVPPGDVPADAAPRLHPDAIDHADAFAWLAARGIADRPLVLLQPASRHAIKRMRRRGGDVKSWPIDAWTALSLRIHAAMPDAGLLLCGAGDEDALLRAIATRADGCPVQVATRDLPLRRLLALASIAHSMVAVDTGPAHVAAAVGCPLVVLYGSESPREWSRRSAFGRPVVELGGPPECPRAADIPFDAVFGAWRAATAGCPP